MAQWSTLLSVTVAPAEVVELASAAASQLIEEAMWLIPSRYPSDVAMNLAFQLSPQSGGTELDFRAAQLTLEGTLEDDGAGKSAVTIASEVLASRTSRTDQIQLERMRDADSRRAQAEEQAGLERARAEQQAERADRLQEQVTTAASTAASQSVELDWARRQPKRVAIVVLLTAAAIAGAIACWLLGAPFWSILVFAVALACSVTFGVRWCTDRDARFGRLLIPAILEAVGVVSAGLDLWLNSGLS